MLILGLLGMYFDAAVVFVTNSSLFFRLAVAILCELMGEFVHFSFLPAIYLLRSGLILGLVIYSYNDIKLPRTKGIISHLRT